MSIDSNERFEGLPREEVIDTPTMTCPMCGSEVLFGTTECPSCGEVLGDLQTLETPSYRLYSIGGVVLATFLGSMLAGGVIMAINFFRLGESRSAWTTIGLSTVATIGMFGLVSLIPEEIDLPNLVYTIPQLLAMHFAAKRFQEPQLRTHTRAGGQIASNWKAAGIGLAVVFVLFVCILVVVFTDMVELP